MEKLLKKKLWKIRNKKVFRFWLQIDEASSNEQDTYWALWKSVRILVVLKGKTTGIAEYEN